MDELDKPVTKTDIAIFWKDAEQRIILFDGTEEATDNMVEFGSLSDGADSRQRLSVDARYDFDEVVAYIENYGKED